MDDEEEKKVHFGAASVSSGETLVSATKPAAKPRHSILKSNVQTMT